MGFVHGNMLQEKQLNKPTMKAAKKVRCFMRNSFSFHFKLKAVMGAEQGGGGAPEKVASSCHSPQHSQVVYHTQCPKNHCSHICQMWQGFKNQIDTNVTVS